MKDLVNAIRQFGEAVAKCGVSAEEATVALQTFGGLWAGDTKMSTSNFDLGVVPRMTIHLPDGSDMVLENPCLEIEVEQETLDHMSVRSGRMAVDRSSVVVSEKKTVKIQNPTPEVAEELIRLIRDE